MASLKAQLQHPLPGHLYDMTALPPWLTSSGLRTDASLAELIPHWNALKDPRALSQLEAQRALTWLALRGSRDLITKRQFTAARAKLETALDLVEDPGLRHLLRCELALDAIRQGEAESAKGWLAECDSAPEVLELDSCFRVAQARLALLQRNSHAALAGVGRQPHELPIAPGWERHAQLVRIHARELLGQAPELPLDESMLALGQAEGLAPRARLEAVKLKVRALRAEQENTAAWYQVPLGAFFAAPWWTLLLAFVMNTGACIAGVGPELGVTGSIVCPQVCRGCQPPYSGVSYTVNDNSQYDVACDNARGEPSRLSDYERFSYFSSHKEQHVPGGAWTMLGIAFIVYYPLGLLIALGMQLRSAAKARSRAPGNAQALAAAEAELRSLGGNLRDEALVPRFSAKRGLVGILLLALPFVVTGSCLAVNLGLRVQ